MSSAPILPPVVALSVVSAGQTSTAFQLRSGHSVFIGTSVNCGLMLRGEGAADIHCYVRFEDGKLWVEDWMSKSGTLINGELITTRVEAQLGDIIQVGSNRIALQEAAQAASPPAAKSAIASTANVTEEAACETLSTRGGDRRVAIPHNTLGTSERTTGERAGELEPWPDLTAVMDGFDTSEFEVTEDETYDKETVALLRAEIEHLQAALAGRDAKLFAEFDDEQEDGAAASDATDEQADPVLARMQELIDEANRSDERVAMLEELLLAAEDANRAEREERSQLEAWINDIEQRLAQREVERQAELESLNERLEQAAHIQERLVQQLRQATHHQAVPQHYHEHLEQLQRDHQKVQGELMQSQKQCAQLQQQLAQVAQEPQRALREERVRLAEEQKLVAKLKLELSSKLTAMGTLTEPESRVDAEADQRIKALRDHLRQIHEQEQQAARSASLAGRLKRLWQRVDG